MVRSKPKSKSLWQSWHSWVTAGLACIVMSWLSRYYLESSNSDDLSVHAAQKKRPPPIDTQSFGLSRTKIDVVKWKSGGRFLRSIIQGRRPVLVTNSPIVNWTIIGTDLFALSKQSNIEKDNLNATAILQGCRWQKDPVFVLGQDRDKGGMLGSAHDRNLIYTDVPFSDFLHSIFDSNTYLYWTGELDAWNNATGVNATSPRGILDSNASSQGWDVLKVLEPGLERIVDEDDFNIWRPMMWLSHPGVVAQTHYDTQHNFFAQLQGIKSFLIFEPDSELYYYPNIHRSYRQSQVHFEHFNRSNSSSSFPRLAGASAIEVIMQPGDLLYIPPFWAHRVESVTMSLSLSVLSPSLLEAELAEIYWNKVPFGEFSSSRALRSRAAAAFLSSVLNSCAEFIPVHCEVGDIFRTVGPRSFSNCFAEDLFEFRFKALFPIPEESPFECWTTDSQADYDKLVDEHRDKFQASSFNIAMQLRKLEADAGVKRTFLRDYVEQIGRWAVGPSITHSFIRHCL